MGRPIPLSRAQLMAHDHLRTIQPYDKSACWTAWKMETRLEIEGMLRDYLGEANASLDLLALNELLALLREP